MTVSAIARWLRIRDLNRDARGAQRNVLRFPRGVRGTFGVGIRSGAVAKFDSVGSVEVARLHALPFDPDVLDAGNFGGHVLDPVNRLLLFGVAGRGAPFQLHHVQNCFWLAKAVLPGYITAAKKCRRDQSAAKNLSRLRKLDSHSISSAPNHLHEFKRGRARLATDVEQPIACMELRR